ncbi:MAG: acyl-CoA thioesterase [Candidatus Margulisbacteria bacterium]|nr:acyl-CoA thioesterase [Candidatus Margulisiibacteriota bacterium]
MKHQFKYRIIYRDTDAEGVVYYANYLALFERGRSELLRDMGISLTKLKEEQNIVFAINRVECDYKAPAQYDDEILVTTEIERLSKARIIFKQEILREGKILVSAVITACALSLKDLRPKRLPPKLLKNVSIK